MGALSARIDFAIPLTSTLDAVIGGRYQDAIGSDDLPETWTLFVGVSIPVGKMLKATLDAP